MMRTPSTRRDERFILPLGRSRVEILTRGIDETVVFGTVVTVSVSGLAFQVRMAVSELPSGTFLDRIVVSVNETAFEGSAIIRNIRSVEDGQIELGCLFHPSATDEERWRVFLAGIEIGRCFAVAAPA
jgi:hypothetical protein